MNGFKYFAESMKGVVWTVLSFRKPLKEEY